jgi:hypothetical protein
MKMIVGDMLIPSHVVDHAAAHIEGRRQTRETWMFSGNMLYQCALFWEASNHGTAWYIACILATRCAGWLWGWLSGWLGGMRLGRMFFRMVLLHVNAQCKHLIADWTFTVGCLWFRMGGRFMLP